MIKTEIFPVKGMSCASCAARVDKTLRSVDGVAEVSVNLANNTVRLSYDTSMCNPETMRLAVERVGFELIVHADNDEKGGEDLWLNNVSDSVQTNEQLSFWGCPLTATIMFALSLFDGLFSGQEIALFFLSTFMLVHYAKAFYVKAIRLLMHGTANMDTLVALSISASYLYSFFNLFFPSWFTSIGLQPHLYFDSVGMITAFVLMGRRLEAKAKRRTDSAISGLLKLRPQSVVQIFPNGAQREKNITEVHRGDVLLARAGEQIAADGVVVQGTSEVDESMLNGEAASVLKKTGSKVMTGTVNRQGLLHYRAEKVGNDTLLAQIVQMVREAQTGRMPIQRIVDKVAAVFVPIVIIAASLSLFLWLTLGGENALSHGVTAFVSVLIIACPCSLGLATPTAVIVAMGLGAKHGILIKDIATLDIARKADVFLFDKTGTLTQGHPVIKETSWINEKLDRQVLLTLEQRSTHPLAQTICQYLEGEETLPVTSFDETPGEGVHGEIDAKQYFLGSVERLKEKNANFTIAQQTILEKWEKQAYTIVALSEGKDVIAMMALCDEAKPEAHDVLAHLDALGIKCIMLTGDSEESARRIANSVGIKEFESGMLPTEKADYVKHLLEKGHRVAMVGDGINDGVALAQADLGIAIGKASDVAVSAAAITILSSNLSKLTDLITLSHRAHRTIKQNLFWAFVYNTLSIPIAAGILFPLSGLMLNPMIASATMALSSVCVVTNSLRMRIR